MSIPRDRSYIAPVFLGTAFLLFGFALVEKVLNLFGTSLPIVRVYPRQLLEWAVMLLMFEVALTLRQLVELRQPREPDTPTDLVSPKLH